MQATSAAAAATTTTTTTMHTGVGGEGSAAWNIKEYMGG
jgi:hypothetical protein